MLALAVLAALELRKDDPIIAEGQMVTGSVGKTVADASGSVGAEVEPAADPAPPIDPPLESRQKEGVLLPLDNGTLRTSDQGPGAPRGIPAVPPIESANTPVPADPVEKTEVPVAPEPPSARPVPLSTADSVPGAQTAKPSAEHKETPAARKDDAAEAKPLIMTTKAPAKLQGKQKAITRTRLELGKSIIFRLTGAEPLTAKTLLLTSPERYVVDVQGEWGIALPRIPKNLLLNGIRAGQRPDAMRLVFELKRKPASAEVVKINAKTLEVRIR